jgi:glyoxylase I family protein
MMPGRGRDEAHFLTPIHRTVPHQSEGGGGSTESRRQDAMAGLTGQDWEEREAWRAEVRDREVLPFDKRPPSSGRGIHHAALICSNVEQTIAFYQGLLGFPLVELVENRDYGGSSHFFFDLGNSTLLGFFDFPGLGLQPGVESFGSVQHIAISVTPEKHAELRTRLDEAGIAYDGPQRGIPESLYLRDPDGIGIELLSDPLMYFGGRRLDEE